MKEPVVLPSWVSMAIVAVVFMVAGSTLGRFASGNELGFLAYLASTLLSVLGLILVGGVLLLLVREAINQARAPLEPAHSGGGNDEHEQPPTR